MKSKDTYDSPVIIMLKAQKRQTHLMQPPFAIIKESFDPMLGQTMEKKYQQKPVDLWSNPG